VSFDLDGSPADRWNDSLAVGLVWHCARAGTFDLVVVWQRCMGVPVTATRDSAKVLEPRLLPGVRGRR
jgi:hypothetical protein